MESHDMDNIHHKSSNIYTVDDNEQMITCRWLYQNQWFGVYMQITYNQLTQSFSKNISCVRINEKQLVPNVLTTLFFKANPPLWLAQQLM